MENNAVVRCQIFFFFEVIISFGELCYHCTTDYILFSFPTYCEGWMAAGKFGIWDLYGIRGICFSLLAVCYHGAGHHNWGRTELRIITPFIMWPTKNCLNSESSAKFCLALKDFPPLPITLVRLVSGFRGSLLSLFVSLLLSFLNSNVALGSAWNLGSICTTDCWFAIWPISWRGVGRQEETKERGRLVGVSVNKFTDKACLECPQTVDLCTYRPQSWKFI